ncbi:serine acetyltransferase [Streptococcus infantarius subsp. infantarius]|nr:serine acetyltransferase [Streptococcus infantarius subsp. infantarius]MCO4573778.1 serine acetyltransferase [Streptococcus infantarius subsp. infantarius]
MDNQFFYEYTKSRRLKLWLTNDHWIYINKYLKFLRQEEKYYKKSNWYYKLLEIYYSRKKNILGSKLGFLVPPNSIGENVTIWHHGSIIINGDAQIGNGCILHGNNCIGNNGKDLGAPKVGNNVDIGYGAIIIGDVVIADNVKIAAGAVVTKSCFTPGATLVGIPAKEVKFKG